MADETHEEVMKLVTDLRETVEKKGFVDKDKVEVLNTIINGYEGKSAEITAVQQTAKNLEQDVKDLKEAQIEFKSADEARQTELKGQITDLEAEIARGIQSRVSDDDPMAWKKTSEEYKSFNLYCGQGERILYQEEHKVLLRTDSATEGGILVPSEMDNVIVKKIVEIDPIRTVARVRTINGKSLEMPIRNTIPIATYEGEAEEGGDSASTYESETVTPFRQTHTTPITRDMLQDGAFDMESEASEDAGTAFGFGEGNGFVLGTGFKQPMGFVIDPRLVTAARAGGGTSNLIFEDDIILLSGDLKVGYNPVYAMNRRSLASLRTRKSDTGSYLWLPGLNGPVANTLNGFPYILANSMPDETGNALSVAFGDFRRGYTIVDRTGMTVIRDEITQKKKAIVEFTWARWNTGLVVLPEAIKLLKVKA